MFKEIKDEKAFDGILNQIIDNISKWTSESRRCASGRKNDGRDDGEYPDRRYGKS